MLSKGRWHWLQPAAQDNIANLSLAVVLRHVHYITSDQSFSSAIHKLLWVDLLSRTFEDRSKTVLVLLAEKTKCHMTIIARPLISRLFAPNHSMYTSNVDGSNIHQNLSTNTLCDCELDLTRLPPKEHRRWQQTRKLYRESTHLYYYRRAVLKI